MQGDLKNMPIAVTCKISPNPSLPKRGTAGGSLPKRGIAWAGSGYKSEPARKFQIGINVNA